MEPEKTRFSALELEIALHPLQRFYDHGGVSSVNEGEKKISEHYDQQDIFVKTQNFIYASLTAGMTIFISDNSFPFIRDAHLFYCNYFYSLMNRFIRAHEETHVLDRFGSLNVLEEAMIAKGFSLRERLSHIEDEEFKANIGGIYGMFLEEQEEGKVLAVLTDINHKKVKEILTFPTI